MPKMEGRPGRRVGRRTLWELIERNRAHRAMVMLWFFLLWMLGVGGAMFFLVLGVVLSVGLWRWLFYARLTPLPLLTALIVSVALAALLGLMYVWWAWHQAEWTIAQLMGASRAPKSEYIETREALTAVSIAAGLKPRPGLFVAPLPRSINAVVVGRTPQSAIVIVTEGMARRVPHELQLAVFASLLGRFRNGGVGWTTLLFSLARPMESFAERLWDAYQWAIGESPGISLAHVLVLPLAALFPVMTAALLPAVWLLVIFAKLFTRSFTGAYMRMARSADAEGMMLLKHPESMARALKTIIPQDNWIPYGYQLNYLAYVRGHFGPETYAEEDCRLEQLISLVGEPTIEMAGPVELIPAPPDVASPLAAGMSDPEVQARRLRMQREREASAKRLARRRKKDREAAARMPSHWW